MCDARGQLAERPELLGLGETLSQPLGLGHVHEQALGGGVSPVLDTAAAKFEVTRAPHRVLAEHLGGARGLAAFPCGDPPAGQRGRRRVEDLGEPEVGTHDFGFRDPERLGEGPVDEFHATGLHDEDRVRGRFDKRFVLHRRLLERVRPLDHLILECGVQPLERILEDLGLARLLLETIGHRVERVSEVAQLPHTGNGDAVVQLSGRQRLRRPRELVQRGGDAAREPTSADHRDDREQRPEEEQLNPQLPKLRGDDVVGQPHAHATPGHSDPLDENRNGDLDDLLPRTHAAKAAHLDVPRRGPGRGHGVPPVRLGGRPPGETREDAFLVVDRDENHAVVTGGALRGHLQRGVVVGEEGGRGHGPDTFRNRGTARLKTVTEVHPHAVFDDGHRGADDAEHEQRRRDREAALQSSSLKG